MMAAAIITAMKTARKPMSACWALRQSWPEIVEKLLFLRDVKSALLLPVPLKIGNGLLLIDGWLKPANNTLTTPAASTPINQTTFIPSQ
jgi:hypothetical protein